MKKHANVAVFVPHAGCPQKCSFCNQRHISGHMTPPTPEMAEKIVENAIPKLKKLNTTAQIAFFGGSFTALDYEYMVSMLRYVQNYLNQGEYDSIRISTRPDYIDEKILVTLKKYNVTDIELGAQSMDETVLQANLRGHMPQDTIDAANMIKQYGFNLGLQMMTGLYMDTDIKSLYTANTIISLKPNYVRIYPAVILKGTKLEQWYNNGIYEPQTLNEAIDLCAILLELFTRSGIAVIKLGLHDGAELKQNIIAGPYHPAFRELCESKVLFDKVISQISEKEIPKGDIYLQVNNKSVSKITGQNHNNIIKLKKIGYNAKIVLDDKYEYLQVGVNNVM